MSLCLYAMEEAMHALGAALLSLAAVLLFEELTFGGLVRLLLAPPPRRAKPLEPQPDSSQPNRSVVKTKLKGESQCSR